MNVDIDELLKPRLFQIQKRGPDGWYDQGQVRLANHENEDLVANDIACRDPLNRCVRLTLIGTSPRGGTYQPRVSKLKSPEGGRKLSFENLKRKIKEQDERRQKRFQNLFDGRKTDVQEKGQEDKGQG